MHETKFFCQLQEPAPRSRSKRFWAHLITSLKGEPVIRASREESRRPELVHAECDGEDVARHVNELLQET